MNTRRRGYARGLFVLLFASIFLLAIPTLGLALVPAGTVTGVVTDSFDAPVVGATVSADSATSSESTTTDADGEYVISGLANGTYYVSATATGLSSGESTEVVISGSAGVTRNIKLYNPGNIIGQVTGPGGSALLSETISARWLLGLGWTDTTVLPDGSFALIDLMPGESQVRFFDDSGTYATKLVTVTVEAAETTTLVSPVELELAGSMSGVVEDAGHEPISGAVVRIAEKDDPDLWIWSTTTNALGEYTIPGCPTDEMTLDGAYYIMASAPGYEARFYNNAATLAASTSTSFTVGDFVVDRDFTLPDDSSTPLGGSATKVSGDVTSRTLGVMAARSADGRLAWTAGTEQSGVLAIAIRDLAEDTVSKAGTVSNSFDVSAEYVFWGDQVLNTSTLELVRTLDVPFAINYVVCDDTYVAYLGDSQLKMVRIGDSWDESQTVPLDNLWEAYIRPGAVHEGRVVINRYGEVPELYSYLDDTLTPLTKLAGETSIMNAVLCGGDVVYSNGATLKAFDIGDETIRTLFTASAEPDCQIDSIVSDGDSVLFRDWDRTQPDGEPEQFNNIRYQVWNSSTSQVTTATTDEGPLLTLEVADIDGSYAYMSQASGVYQYPVAGGSAVQVDEPVYEPADHIKPAVNSGETFFLDNRDYPEMNRGTQNSDFDIYARKLGASERKIDTKVATSDGPWMRPQVGPSFAVYAVDNGADEHSQSLVDLVAYDKESETIESVASGLNWGSLTYQLDGDAVFVSDDPDVQDGVPGELRRIDIATGHIDVGPPAVDYNLRFLASDGYALYTSTTDGKLSLWNADTDVAVDTTMPAGFDFDKAAFDYPYVAYVEGYLESGPVKVVNVVDGEINTLCEWDWLTTPNGWLQGPIDIQANTVVAGNHLYSFRNGFDSIACYNFGSAGAVDGLDLGGGYLVYTQGDAVYRRDITNMVLGGICGTVTDHNHAALNGVSVEISSGGTTTTAGAGGYSFSSVPPTTYALHFSKSGYHSVTATTVVVSPEATTTLNVQLNESVPPTKPTGLYYSAITTTSVTLSWTASTDTGGSGVDHYEVYADGESVATTTGVNYRVTGAAGSSALYTVVAVDEVGNRSVTSDGKIVTIPGQSGSQQVGTGETTVTVSLGGGDELVAAFDNVTSAGLLQILVTGQPPVALDSGFRILGTCYNITFSGSFAPSMTITAPYDPLIPDGQALEMQVHHWTGAAWVHLVPTSVDTVNHTVTFVTGTLSPFALVLESSIGSTTTLDAGFGSAAGPSTYAVRPATIVGLLKDSLSDPLPGKTVIVQAEYSAGSWTNVGTATDAGAGAYTYAVPAPLVQTAYRLRFAGDAFNDASNSVSLTLSPPTTTLYNPTVSATKPKHGRTATFKAWITPGAAALAGTGTMRLYRWETKRVWRKVGRKWKRVNVKYWRLRTTKTMTANTEGRFVATYKPTYKGSWKMVVSYSGAGYLPSSISKTFYVK